MVLALLLLAAPAEAKDLRGRAGVGFTHTFGQPTSIGLRYTFGAKQPTATVQLGLDAGFDLGGDTDAWYGGARLRWGFVAEDNMILHAGVAAGWAGGVDAARVQPTIGAQVFLFGVENLGIEVDFGANVDIGAPVTVQTVASVGATYWF